MFRRRRCEHDWHKTNEVAVLDDDGDYLRTVYYIYCPKCRKRKVIRPHLWPVLQNECRLRDEYTTKTGGNA